MRNQAKQFKFQVATYFDAELLHSMDLKTYYRAQTVQWWRKVIRDDMVYVLVVNREPVGFIHLDTSSNPCRIARCGVLPTHRRNGYGSALMQHAWNTVEVLSKPITGVEIVVPESCIEPGSDRDVSRFLSGLGYVALTPLLSGYFREDGDPVAGVKFVRSFNDRNYAQSGSGGEAEIRSA